MEKLILPSLLSVSDGILMVEHILKTTQPFTEIDPKMLNLHTKLALVNKRLVKYQKYSSKSLFTDALLVLDKRRINALNALRELIHGMSVCLIDETSKKAAKLYSIFAKYIAKTYNMNYKEETAALISLFSDFDRPVNLNLLTDLGILPFYESLKTAHFAFEIMSKEKSAQKTDHISESEATTTILTESIPAIADILAWVQLNNQHDPIIYGEIYNQLVKFINEINTAARARKTRKHSIEPKIKKYKI